MYAARVFHGAPIAIVRRSLLLFNLVSASARRAWRSGRIVNRLIERDSQQRACRRYMTINRNVYTRPFEDAELDCKQTRSSLARCKVIRGFPPFSVGNLGGAVARVRERERGPARSSIYEGPG